MTADANQDALALYEWIAASKVVLKSAKAIFKGPADNIDKYYADLEKEVKQVANEEKVRQRAAKKAEEESLKADIAVKNWRNKKPRHVKKLKKRQGLMKRNNGCVRRKLQRKQRLMKRNNGYGKKRWQRKQKLTVRNNGHTKQKQQRKLQQVVVMVVVVAMEVLLLARYLMIRMAQYQIWI